MITDLPTVGLGLTGMDITRVGLGSWAIGGNGWGFGWGTQDENDSIAAVRRAVELGVNWVDTAAIYGYGHSEEIIGRALASMPEDDRPYVFTKCGVVPNGVDPMKPNIWSGTTESLRQGVEASLSRLGVERIDLCQVHWPSKDATVEQYWATMLELEREGKIRAAGLSNHDVSLLERAEAVGHVGSVQPPFSLVKRSAAADLIPWCAQHETGVIVYSPMQAGLLSGSFSPERVTSLPPDDWRRDDDEFRAPKLQANLELADSLRPIAEKHAVNPAVVAIAWTLAFRGVGGAIVGARSAKQVDGWVDVARLELDSDDLEAIEAALKRTGAGAGPLAPSASHNCDV